jgi:hypothetical protein
MKKIILGEGLEDIKLGITPDELKKRLGYATEVETSTEEEMELWHYDELQLSFGFSKAYDNRLLSITTSNLEASIEEVTLIGDSLQEVLDKLEVFNFGDIDIEDISTPEYPQQQVVTVLDFSLNLWFDQDELAEIQWGPFWDDKSDKPIWPDK